MPLTRLFLSTLLIVTAATAETRPVSDLGYRAAELATRQAWDRIPRCEQTTSRQGFTLRFTGMLDQRFLECVARHLRKNDVTLEIASTGNGESVPGAIATAQLIWLKRWTVRVIGICAGACSSFVVPAAKSVSVAPYSVIVRRGGVTRSSLQADLDRSKALAKAQAKGPPEEVEKTIQRSVNALHLQVDALVLFGARDCFYQKAATVADGAANANTGNRRRAWLANAAHIAQYTATVPAKEYWYPTTDADWQKLEHLYPEYAFAREQPQCN